MKCLPVRSINCSRWKPLAIITSFNPHIMVAQFDAQCARHIIRICWYHDHGLKWIRTELCTDDDHLFSSKNGVQPKAFIWALRNEIYECNQFQTQKIMHVPNWIRFCVMYFVCRICILYGRMRRMAAVQRICVFFLCNVPRRLTSVSASLLNIYV